jgi:hypothetical protein
LAYSLKIENKICSRSLVHRHFPHNHDAVRISSLPILRLYMTERSAEWLRHVFAQSQRPLLTIQKPKGKDAPSETATQEQPLHAPNSAIARLFNFTCLLSVSNITVCLSGCGGGVGQFSTFPHTRDRLHVKARSLAEVDLMRQLPLQAPLCVASNSAYI